MDCPACGRSETDVIDTRKTFDSVRRRRRCRSCRYTWTTREVTVAEVTMELTRMDAIEALNRIQDLLLAVSVGNSKDQ